MEDALEEGGSDEPNALIVAKGEGWKEVDDGANLQVQRRERTAVEFPKSSVFFARHPADNAKCQEGVGHPGTVLTTPDAM